MAETQEFFLIQDLLNANYFLWGFVNFRGEGMGNEPPENFDFPLLDFLGWAEGSLLFGKDWDLKNPILTAYSINQVSKRRKYALEIHQISFDAIKREDSIGNIV